MKKLNITVGEHNITVRLRETPTAISIYESCPFNSIVNTWGEEIYFETNIKVKKEYDAKQVLNKGEIAFWVEGTAVAIGYGPTPVSVKDEIRLVTDVNIFGDTDFNLDLLKNVKSGENVIVDRISD